MTTNPDATLLKTRSEIDEISKLLITAKTEATTKLSEISSLATEAIGLKTQIADYQAVVATKSDHIQKAQEHADKVRGDLDRLLTGASQQATETEGEKQRAQSAADSATELLTGIRTNKGLADADVASITAARDSAKESAVSLKGLADKSQAVDLRVAEYEKRLAGLESQCAKQLETITDLLPGATSAGLAYAFDARRKTFMDPSSRWQYLFVGSVILLVVLAFTGVLHVYQAEKLLTYDEQFRLWLARLPVAGALVWLALHASRESALAKRLEEDYGYKAAIASTFLGFHKQMAEIGTDVMPGSPLSKLCSDTLATIASPPGRIYDKHKLTVSPSDELKDIGRSLTNK
jgi:hypothetical protein